MSLSFFNDHFHYFSGPTYDSSERSKSEISVNNVQQRFDIGILQRRPSLDSTSRHRTPQIQLTSTAISFIDTDDIEEDSKYHTLFCLTNSCFV